MKTPRGFFTCEQICPRCHSRCSHKKRSPLAAHWHKCPVYNHHSRTFPEPCSIQQVRLGRQRFPSAPPPRPGRWGLLSALQGLEGKKTGPESVNKGQGFYAKFCRSRGVRPEQLSAAIKPLHTYLQSLSLVLAEEDLPTVCEVHSHFASALLGT